MKVAIVHEWLDTYAGSERVVEQFLRIWPDADLYCVCDFLPENERAFLQGHTPRTSFIQRLPGAKKHFRKYLPLMPIAIEQFDMTGYDLVVSSNHAVAKGVLTGPGQLHVSYVHSPMRYAYDLQHQYLRESGNDRGLTGAITRWMLHRLRIWDRSSAAGVDVLVGNSSYIAERIMKVWRREAEVVHPPVDVARFALAHGKQDHFLVASRMVPYKRIELVAEAFRRMPGRQLRIIGDGVNMPAVRAAAGDAPNISFMGRVDQPTLVREMQQAAAVIHAAEEDFGIAIVSHPDRGSLVTVSPDLVETLSAFLVEAQQAVNTPNRLKPKRVDRIMTWSVRDFGGVDVSVRTDGMIELAPWNTSDRLHPTIAPESVDTLIALLRYAAVVANEQVRPSDTL